MQFKNTPTKFTSLWISPSEENESPLSCPLPKRMVYLLVTQFLQSVGHEPVVLPDTLMVPRTF